MFFDRKMLCTCSMAGLISNKPLHTSGSLSLARRPGSRATILSSQQPFPLLLTLIPSYLYLSLRFLLDIHLIMSGTRLRSNLKKAGKKTSKCLQSAAWQTCKCVLFTICSPCICCAILFLPRRRRSHRGRSIEPLKPQMPAPRRRALSIPSADWHEDQQTLDQPQSSFMTKLPLEIRRMIYERALGGASIHMGIERGLIHARRCGLEGICRCGRQEMKPEKDLEFVLPLLRTCRQM